MNGDRWISLIALSAWIVFALSAYRARQVSARRTATLAIAWAAIFALVVAVFTAIGR